MTSKPRRWSWRAAVSPTTPQPMTAARRSWWARARSAAIAPVPHEIDMPAPPWPSLWISVLSSSRSARRTKPPSRWGRRPTVVRMTRSHETWTGARRTAASELVERKVRRLITRILRDYKPREQVEIWLSAADLRLGFSEHDPLE